MTLGPGGGRLVARTFISAVVLNFAWEMAQAPCLVAGATINLGNELTDRNPDARHSGAVRRRQRIGGLLSFYHGAA